MDYDRLDKPDGPPTVSSPPPEADHRMSKAELERALVLFEETIQRDRRAYEELATR